MGWIWLKSWACIRERNEMVWSEGGERMEVRNEVDVAY